MQSTPAHDHDVGERVSSSVPTPRDHEGEGLRGKAVRGGIARRQAKRVVKKGKQQYSHKLFHHVRAELPQMNHSRAAGNMGKHVQSLNENVSAENCAARDTQHLVTEGSDDKQRRAARV